MGVPVREVTHIMNPQQFQDYAKKIIDNCGKVIVGKDEVIRQVVVSFLCGGHVLLEVMEEGQITVDGATYPMQQPFMVMATQNPIESYGTFPLPEAQMDRFFMRLSMGYMEREQEMSVISRPSTLALVEDLQQVVTAEETLALRKQFHQVHVSDDVMAYIMDIVQATRKAGVLVGGVSTRGAIALYKAAQVTAAMEGRDYVIPEDVVREALPVLAHRLTSASGSRTDGENFLREQIEALAVPLEDVTAL